MKHPYGYTTHLIEEDLWTEPEKIIIQGGFAPDSAFRYYWVPPLTRNY
jgi:hypothetical protein